MTCAVSFVYVRVAHSIQIYIYIFYIVTGLGQMPAGGRGCAPHFTAPASERAKKYAMAFCYFATPNTAHKCKKARREPTVHNPHSPIMQSSVYVSMCVLVFLAVLMSHQEPCPGTSWRVFYPDFYRRRQKAVAWLKGGWLWGIWGWWRRVK